MTLSLVLPCFNEEATIEQTVRSCVHWMTDKQITGEIIVVNDGSGDRSGEILVSLQSRFPLLRIITHAINQGYGIAVRSGCDAARMEWIAFMDSDGQFDIRDLEKLLECSLPLLRGRARERVWEECSGQPLPQSSPFKGRGREAAVCSFVTGRRQKRADSMLRNVYGKGLGILTWVLFGVWVRDINCGMKLFKRELWPSIRPVYGVEKMFNTELFLRLKTIEVVWKQVDVSHYPRRGGKPTGDSWRVMQRMLKEIWKLRLGNPSLRGG